MRKRARRVLAGLLAAVALTAAGCGHAPPPSVLAGGETRVASDAVITVGFDRISEVYVEPVDLGALTLDGLEALSAIEPRFAVERQQGGIQATVGELLIAELAEASAEDAQAWAQIAAAIIERGYAFSPKLREAGTDQVHETFFEAMSGHLDPYSRYVNPAEAERERAYRDGYGGIGLLLDLDQDGRPFIDRVFADGPADRAGLRDGQRILAVDGVPATEWSLETLGDRLRGPRGTVVRVTVSSATAPSAEPVRTVALTREQVIPNAVSTRLEERIAFLRVSRFNAATANDLAHALESALERLGPHARGVVLDLRGNPGGLLDQSVAVADLFIPRGEIIFTRGRHPDSLQRFNARQGDLAGGLPLVVLVDGRSASGSEVVAAALQDSGRAVVVGATTFGKGSVQTVTRLPNNGELFLTWSRIFAPSGYTLNEQGVMPTLCTSDEPLDAAELIRRFKDGDLAPPLRLGALRRSAPDDDEALGRLRDACPWRPHDEEIEIAVAKSLLLDPTLFEGALAANRSPSVAQR